MFSIGSFIFTLFYPDLCLREQPPLHSGFELCLAKGRTWWQIGGRERMTLGHCQVAVVVFQVLPGGHLHSDSLQIAVTQQLSNVLIQDPFRLVKIVEDPPKSFCFSLSVYHVRN